MFENWDLMSTVIVAALALYGVGLLMVMFKERKAARAGGGKDAEEAKKKASESQENLVSLAWAVVIALLIRTFVVAPFKIPSGSMRPTLMEGDRILVNKFGYYFSDPQRGQIMVFKYPDDPKRPFIKRVVAVGGDEVEIRNGGLLINGQPLDEPEIFATNEYFNQGRYGKEGNSVTVPEDHYFVLGDNSSASHDSRFWGFVPEDYRIGKAFCIFWPPQRIGKLE